MNQGARKDWGPLEPLGWRHLCELVEAQSEPHKLIGWKHCAHHERRWQERPGKRSQIGPPHLVVGQFGPRRETTAPC
jgi:hypothetical protein